MKYMAGDGYKNVPGFSKTYLVHLMIEMAWPCGNKPLKYNL